VAEEVSRSFLDYSMSVIISRALPDARDGLKPSQRRILYAMHDCHYFQSQHRKCAKICGDTSGNYHPHGEAVIYPTLVHMPNRGQCANDLSTVRGTSAQSKRSTRGHAVHRSAHDASGAALMTDMARTPVDFVSNYDETRTEPTVFHLRFPIFS